MSETEKKDDEIIKNADSEVTISFDDDGITPEQIASENAENDESASEAEWKKAFEEVSNADNVKSVTPTAETDANEPKKEAETAAPENTSDAKTDAGNTNDAEDEANRAWLESLFNKTPEKEQEAVTSPTETKTKTATKSDIEEKSHELPTREKLLEAIRKSDNPAVKNFVESVGDDAEAFAGMMEEMLKASGYGDALSKINEFDKSKAELDRIAKERADAEYAEQMMAFDKKIAESHPDANDIFRKDRHFPEWFEKQPAGIQALFTAAHSPEDVISGLNMYKSSFAPAERKFEQRRNVYSNPANRNGTTINANRPRGGDDVGETEKRKIFNEVINH